MSFFFTLFRDLCPAPIVQAPPLFCVPTVRTCFFFIALNFPLHDIRAPTTTTTTTTFFFFFLFHLSFFFCALHPRLRAGGVSSSESERIKSKRKQTNKSRARPSIVSFSLSLSLSPVSLSVSLSPPPPHPARPPMDFRVPQTFLFFFFLFV